MPSFSASSWAELTTCHADLIVVLSRVIEVFDFTVIDGHRTEEEQNRAFRTGHSKVRWPNSRHNSYPSRAIDIAPWYPETPHIRWSDTERFYYLAGYVMMEAHVLLEEGVIEHKLRWGGDWDRDTEVRDQTFFDLGHFELTDV